MPHTISDTETLQQGMALVHSPKSPVAKQVLKMSTEFDIDVDEGAKRKIQLVQKNNCVTTKFTFGLSIHVSYNC